MSNDRRTDRPVNVPEWYAHMEGTYSTGNESDANLTEADLRGATYDRRTAWPDGFDPDSAGATQAD